MPLRKLSLCKPRSLALLALAGSLPLLLSASHTPTLLETVLDKGELRIISRNGPTTYFEGRQGLDGYEYTLAKAFADHLGVELSIIEEENFSSIFASLGAQQGDFAAAGLSVSAERTDSVRYSATYMEVSQELLYRSGSKRPDSIEDLYDKTLMVISNSAHAERLRQLQLEHPQLRWHEQSDLEMIDLIEMVHTGTIDYAIVDSNAYTQNRNLYPRATSAFTISDSPRALAWAFPINGDNSLLDEANQFLSEARSNGFLAAIREQYYGKDNVMDAGSATTFARRLNSRLPRWQAVMQTAAEAHDLDWQLLAAISYQESHWNPKAKSHTGVRGLMMLTQTTAKEMGVRNRLDPEQSIQGGAGYYRKIFDRIPAEVQGADRTWLALAAYNVGFGHLEDARTLTERMGGDPNKWDDISQHLPLLAKSKYYRTLKHGYARGWEPVEYVQNIRSFYNTIAWHQQIQQRRLAAAEKDRGLIQASLKESARNNDTTSLL